MLTVEEASNSGMLTTVGWKVNYRELLTEIEASNSGILSSVGWKVNYRELLIEIEASNSGIPTIANFLPEAECLQQEHV